MITWLGISMAIGTLFTAAYATFIYALVKVSLRKAGFLGALSTLLTLIGISALMLSGSKAADAGGIFLHAVFIIVACIVGGALGSIFFMTAVETIESRGGT